MFLSSIMMVVPDMVDLAVFSESLRLLASAL